MRRRNKGTRRAASMAVAEAWGRLGSTPVKEPESSFTVTNTDVTACSRAMVGEIHISSDLWYRLVHLCQRFNTEWMGLLTGQVENDVAVVDGIYFPPQEVGGAHVNVTEEASEYLVNPNTIGAIHSHVGMAARFSSTDVDHANWPVEIVLNSKAEYEATLRLKVPCGEYMRGRALIHLGTDTDVEQMVAHIEEGIRIGLRVRPPRPTYPASVWNGNSYKEYEGL